MSHNQSAKHKRQAIDQIDDQGGDEPLPMPRILKQMRQQRRGALSGSGQEAAKTSAMDALLPGARFGLPVPLHRDTGAGYMSAEGMAPAEIHRENRASPGVPPRPVQPARALPLLQSRQSDGRMAAYPSQPSPASDGAVSTAPALSPMTLSPVAASQSSPSALSSMSAQSSMSAMSSLPVSGAAAVDPATPMPPVAPLSAPAPAPDFGPAAQPAPRSAASPLRQIEVGNAEARAPDPAPVPAAMPVQRDPASSFAAIPAQMRIKPVPAEEQIIQAPSPVATARHGWRQRWSVRPVALAATLGTMIFLGFTHAGRDARSARPLLNQIDGLAELAGLGIRQVSLKGHRFTADGDIFDALELDKHRSMLSFSIARARARLEALPWIDKANIGRDLPDQLNIEVSERVPFAVWRAAGRHQLIDATGRVLAVIKPDGADHLPLVIGAGAATKASSLLRTIKAYPNIAKRLVAVERVGGRRWTLWFAGGPRSELAVHLPQENYAAAIARLDRLNANDAVLNRALATIDLRLPHRMTLRPAAPRRRGRAQSVRVEHPGRT